MGLLAGGLIGGGATLDHVPLGVADLAMRIQRQYLSAQVAARPAQLSQADLQLVGLFYSVLVQQVVNGHITWKKGQPIGQFETFVTKGTAVAQRGPTKGRLVNQVQSQSRGQGVRRAIADAERVGVGQSLVLPSALHGQARRGQPLGGIECVEFFFAGRNQR